MAVQSYFGGRGGGGGSSFGHGCPLVCDFPSVILVGFAGGGGGGGGGGDVEQMSSVIPVTSECWQSSDYFSRLLTL